MQSNKDFLERMKTRSREFRRNGDAPVKRTALPRGMKSSFLVPPMDVHARHVELRCVMIETHQGFEEPNMATIEHILPIKEGGANESENLIAMCLACNRARGYAYNQARKTSREEIDDVLEWLWMHPQSEQITPCSRHPTRKVLSKPSSHL